MNGQSLVIFRPEEEKLIAEELALPLKRDQSKAQFLLINKSEIPPSIFIRQYMPSVVKFDQLSIKNLTDQVIHQITEYINPDESWRLHIFDLGTVENGKLFQRTRLVEEGVEGWLKKKNKTLQKKLILDEDVSSDNQKLIQVFIPDKDVAFISACSISSWGFWPVRFKGGFVPIADRKNLPSRAFKKLVEAEELLGLKIANKETVYDLGASPGSWTAIAAERQAKIFAIDRSPLSTELMRNKNVNFIKGDAFKIYPEKKIDWLICDVAAFPEKTFQMIKTWGDKKLFKNCVITFKFTGEPKLDILNSVREYASNKFERFYLRRLTNNKNEVTLAGTLS